MEIEMLAVLLMGAAALVSVGFIIFGLIDMQRMNASASDVMELQGVIRQMQMQEDGDVHAVLTLNVEEDVLHVDCTLPAPWFGKAKYRVTDLVPVLWRRGDKRAVAQETIRNGQRMFLIGLAGLTAAALMYILLG